MPGSTPRDRLQPVDETTGATIYYDSCAGTYHTWWDNTAYEPVSTALLLTVASVRNVQPETLDPLAECIDPDALNQIFSHWQGDKRQLGNGSISFRFADCTITVRSTGEIIVDPIETTSSCQCSKTPA